jgi:hypothetical protein
VARESTKIDLINRLARQRRYRRCLILCAVTTGLRRGEIDRACLAVCHRLMYRCPSDYSDGWPIDFRSVGLDISACVSSIRERGYRYDIILVDSWHEYGASMRDLTEALSLLTERGTIVVNNCLPRAVELPGPSFFAGGWCDMISRAYLDFVFDRPTLEYRTVDIDYGCGVIRERPSLARLCRWWPTSRKRKALIARWRGLGNGFNKAFYVLQQDTTLLYNLCSVDDFLVEEQRTGITS